MSIYSVKKQFLILLIMTLSLSACNRRTQELVDDQQEKANATPLPPDDLPPEVETPQEGGVTLEPNTPPAAMSCQISLISNSISNIRVFENCVGATAAEPKYTTFDSADLSAQTHAQIEMSYTYDSLTYTYATYKVQFYNKKYGKLSPIGLYHRYDVNLLDQNSMSLYGTVPNSNQQYLLNCKVRSSCSK